MTADRGNGLGANLLAVTPVSPFRPRRWKGALVPHTAEIVLENLDADKRPLAATTDFHELFHIGSVTIREDTSTAVRLLFDADHSLQERIIAEQFLKLTTTRAGLRRRQPPGQPIGRVA